VCVATGWHDETKERTRSRFKNDIASHICDLAKEPDGEKATDQTMAIVVADVLQQKHIAPHVQAALKKIGSNESDKATASPVQNAPADTCAAPPTNEKRALIDTDTAIKLRYTAGTRQRGEQAYRNEIGKEHAPVAKITKRMNDMFACCCPTPFSPGEQFTTNI